MRTRICKAIGVVSQQFVSGEQTVFMNLWFECPISRFEENVDQGLEFKTKLRHKGQPSQSQTGASIHVYES